MKKPTKNSKLEVRLTKAEIELIRRKFGRAAAAVARDFLVGYRVTNPNPPSKKATAAFLRIFVLHRQQAIKMRQLLSKPGNPQAADILRTEEFLYNQLTKTIINLCFLNSSVTNKAE